MKINIPWTWWLCCVSFLGEALWLYWLVAPKSFMRDLITCYRRYCLPLWNRVKELVGWRIVVRTDEDFQEAIRKRDGRFHELVLDGGRFDSFTFPPGIAVVVDNLEISAGSIVQGSGSRIVIEGHDNSVWDFGD